MFLIALNCLKRYGLTLTPGGGGTGENFGRCVPRRASNPDLVYNKEKLTRAKVLGKREFSFFLPLVH